ncbi:uncharacterized protein EV420DRAFT_1580807 [Desarmillaria tabescens]|uniref:Uncharacterized protein n=1 Tax=Armillaria tabescens TaxID=1929756 RepID=A0AA39MNU9_ARMTA|nr:uncharacterized protein EV420DRAFT_1580807 [Desarmillaria tabescens]KAK0441182.1 hypothetical protein EV420DRAFT_1580807 [Desarmillaria tabescens]
MTLPAELTSLILSDLWAIQSSTDEHTQTFANCSLVSKQWTAIMKEVNSTHTVIPFSYNAGQLYTIRSMSSMSNPLLCRTITLRVDYVIMPQLLLKARCSPSIAANNGIELILRKLFYGPNAPRNATHIYIDYLDDPQVHIPLFWIPRQIAKLTIIYHYRRWVPFGFRDECPFRCQCNHPMVDRGVRQLCIMGSTSVIAHRLITPLTEWKCLTSLITAVRVSPAAIPVPLRDSLTQTSYDYRRQYVGPEFAPRVMFGERLDWSSFQTSKWYPIDLSYYKYYIPMLEQVIPLGSVGYIDPLTRKFVVLFNAIDPTTSNDLRIPSIPSILEMGGTKVIEDPWYSSAWDYAYNKFDILHKLGAWTKGRSVYSIPLGLDMDKTLCLGLGRAFRRDFEGNQFKNWLTEHRQIIMDVFGDDHPYIRKRVDLVTTTVDSSQYVWFAHLGHKLHVETGSSEEALRKPGRLWGEVKVPQRYTHPTQVLVSWEHISTVGQTPMTVKIRCYSVV